MKEIFIYGIGNALVDSEYKISEDELKQLKLKKGCMELNDIQNHNRINNELNEKHGAYKEFATDPPGIIFTTQCFFLSSSFILL